MNCSILVPQLNSNLIPRPDKPMAVQLPRGSVEDEVKLSDDLGYDLVEF
jgi:hypothetical protein